MARLRFAHDLVEVAVLILAAATILDAAVSLATGTSSGWMWVDLRPVPFGVGRAVTVAFALWVILSHYRGPAWSGSLGFAACGFAVLCMVDALGALRLQALGSISGLFPLSASAATAVVLALFGLQRLRDRRPRRSSRVTLAVAVPLTIGMVLFQMLTFGETDYRRPADAALVFGARVHQDGRLSWVLADRVDTACQLWKEGLVGTIVLSGGRDAGAVASEAEAMRSRCLENGVPHSVLILDESGVNTLASVRTAAEIGKRRDLADWLVVSHDYHLARVKMLAARQGLRARTVPARESRVWRHKWIAVARETAAILAWFVAPSSFDTRT
ncbi:MAG: YdcF family protein [Planctomycetota bacterium]